MKPLRRLWFVTFRLALPLACAINACAQLSPANPVSPAQTPSADHAQIDPAPVACPAASITGDITYPIRLKAFEAIDQHHPGEARRLMRCAIIADHTDQIALRQEVYLDIDAGDSGDAIEDIEALRKLGAVDAQLDAQEGYLYADKKEYALAKQAFRRAIATGDPSLRFASLKALGNINAEYTSRTIEFDVDGQYLNRFNDGVVDALLHLNQRLGQRSPFQAYLNVRLLRDTASQAGKLPEIFDDNAFLTGIGLAFQPAGAHFALSAEANEAYVFYAGRNHTAALVPDFRTVAGYYNVFRAAPRSRFAFQANGSIGFYSRYDHDAIAYLQPQESVDLVRRDELRLAPYLQESFAFDTNQQYYNNIAEIIPGLALYLKRLSGLTLGAEYVRGYYLPFHTNSPNPYGSSYNDFRIHLTVSKTIPLAGRGEQK